MIELLLFGGVAILGIALVVSAFAVVMIMLRALLWLVLLPFKLLLGLLVGIVVFPIVAVLTLVGLVVGGALVAVPLLPLLALAFLAWVVVKLARPAIA